MKFPHGWSRRRSFSAGPPGRIFQWDSLRGVPQGCPTREFPHGCTSSCVPQGCPRRCVQQGLSHEKFRLEFPKVWSLRGFPHEIPRDVPQRCSAYSFLPGGPRRNYPRWCPHGVFNRWDPSTEVRGVGPSVRIPRLVRIGEVPTRGSSGFSSRVDPLWFPSVRVPKSVRQSVLGNGPQLGPTRGKTGRVLQWWPPALFHKGGPYDGIPGRLTKGGSQVWSTSGSLQRRPHLWSSK